MKILLLILILGLGLFAPEKLKENKFFDSFISNSINLITATESMPENIVKAKVVKVVDGDTVNIKIDNEIKRVRMLLVDTPETSHPLLGSQPYGEEAKKFTKSILEKDTFIYLEKDIDETDSYGRLLGYIWYKDKNNEFKMINEELIREGYARYAYAYNDYKYKKQFKSVEETAKLQKINIWKEDGYVNNYGFSVN